MDKFPPTIEESVMNKIKKGQVRLKSKYIFLAEKLGIGSIVVLSILLGVLFFSLLLFYLQTTDNLIYLSFGREGFLAFLESFPYWLVSAFILIVFIAGIILRKANLLYKKSFSFVTVGLLVMVGLGGGLLTSLGVGEYFEEKGYEETSEAKFIRPFLHDCFEGREHGIAGRVTEKNEEFFWLQTPTGIRKVFPVTPPVPEFLRQGHFVVIVGEQDENVFYARRILILQDQRAHMIRRAVRVKYGPLPPPLEK